jgi:5-methylcytosine-specific restriction endonuclease McrA
MSLRSDPEKMREYKRDYARKNRESQRNYMRKVYASVVQMLGGKCIDCGCKILKALEINHIHGGGRKEERKRGRKSYLLDIYKGRRKTNDLNILCRVCNNKHYLETILGLKGKWTVTFEQTRE